VSLGENNGTQIQNAVQNNPWLANLVLRVNDPTVLSDIFDIDGTLAQTYSISNISNITNDLLTYLSYLDTTDQIKPPVYGPLSCIPKPIVVPILTYSNDENYYKVVGFSETFGYDYNSTIAHYVVDPISGNNFVPISSLDPNSLWRYDETTAVIRCGEYNLCPDLDIEYLRDFIRCEVYTFDLTQDSPYVRLLVSGAGIVATTSTPSTKVDKISFTTVLGTTSALNRWYFSQNYQEGALVTGKRDIDKTITTAFCKDTHCDAALSAMNIQELEGYQQNDLCNNINLQKYRINNTFDLLPDGAFLFDILALDNDADSQNLYCAFFNAPNDAKARSLSWTLQESALGKTGAFDGLMDSPQGILYRINANDSVTQTAFPATGNNNLYYRQITTVNTGFQLLAVNVPYVANAAYVFMVKLPRQIVATNFVSNSITLYQPGTNTRYGPRSNWQCNRYTTDEYKGNGHRHFIPYLFWHDHSIRLTYTFSWENTLPLRYISNSLVTAFRNGQMYFYGIPFSTYKAVTNSASVNPGVGPVVDVLNYAPTKDTNNVFFWGISSSDNGYPGITTPGLFPIPVTLKVEVTTLLPNNVSFDQYVYRSSNAWLPTPNFYGMQNVNYNTGVQTIVILECDPSPLYRNNLDAFFRAVQAGYYAYTLAFGNAALGYPMQDLSAYAHNPGDDAMSARGYSAGYRNNTKDLIAMSAIGNFQPGFLLAPEPQFDVSARVINPRNYVYYVSEVNAGRDGQIIYGKGYIPAATNIASFSSYRAPLISDMASDDPQNTYNQLTLLQEPGTVLKFEYVTGWKSGAIPVFCRIYTRGSDTYSTLLDKELILVTNDGGQTYTYTVTSPIFLSPTNTYAYVRLFVSDCFLYPAITDNGRIWNDWSYTVSIIPTGSSPVAPPGAGAEQYAKIIADPSNLNQTFDFGVVSSAEIPITLAVIEANALPITVSFYILDNNYDPIDGYSKLKRIEIATMTQNVQTFRVETGWIVGIVNKLSMIINFESSQVEDVANMQIYFANSYTLNPDTNIYNPIPNVYSPPLYAPSPLTNANFAVLKAAYAQFYPAITFWIELDLLFFGGNRDYVFNQFNEVTAIAGKENDLCRCASQIVLTDAAETYGYGGTGYTILYSSYDTNERYFWQKFVKKRQGRFLTSFNPVFLNDSTITDINLKRYLALYFR